MSKSESIDRAAQKWDRHEKDKEEGVSTGLTWWDAGPAIDAHINQKITGDPDESWIDYTLRTHFGDRLPVGEWLVLGCGNGHLERKLAALGAFDHCDAYDISPHSIALASSRARQAGFQHIDYHVADVNELELPAGKYDTVWMSAAMHHFSALEFVYGQLRQGLAPHGLLVMFEYVGPNRFQFSKRQKEVTNLCLQLLPERYRQVPPQAIEQALARGSARRGPGWYANRVMAKAREGDLLGVVHRRLVAYRAKISGQMPAKSSVTFPTESSVAADDPSEAVRSAELLTVLEESFEVIEKRGAGGNIIQYLLKDIAGNFSAADPDSQALVRMIQTIEDTLIQCGEFEDDFAYVVARPRANPAIQQT